MELLAYAGDDILAAHMVPAHLRKAPGKLLHLITQNMDLHYGVLWSVFKSKEEGTIEVNDRSLDTIKCRNCLIN